MGKRGEGWVAIQALILLAIFLAPLLDRVPTLWELRLLGVLLIAVGAVVLALGALALGRNLTAFPKPVPDGQLVTTQIYAYVRHPLYSGLIAASLGWGLLAGSPLALGLALVLFLFFDLKSRREEIWLAQQYPEYPQYRTRVKKLIPWIY